MPEILDAGDIGYWRYWIPEKWMLRMPGVGAGDACCFIIVCCTSCKYTFIDMLLWVHFCRYTFVVTLL